ncbi:MAG: nitroreductase family deazaflavin-dependent oxidoreductase [Ktedonobacteraceae bacterium]|nr:nitroreductase family deazaflavin-dependent oxidoreductase [Ktedonobacteraceae bacterium]
MPTRPNNEWNQKMIEDFRANRGKVRGMVEGTFLPMALLTTIGARSGQPRVTPVVYVQEGDRLFVSASNGGMPTNPNWYHNILAHPEVAVEVGDQKFQAKAVVITGKERDELYAKQARLMPNFEEYQQQTTRVIPVVELVRQ